MKNKDIISKSKTKVQNKYQNLNKIPFIIIIILLLIIIFIVQNNLQKGPPPSYEDISNKIDCNVMNSENYIVIDSAIDFQNNCFFLNDDNINIDFEERILVSFQITHGGCLDIKNNVDIDMKVKNGNLMFEVRQGFDLCEALFVDSKSILIDSSYKDFNMYVNYVFN